MNERSQQQMAMRAIELPRIAGTKPATLKALLRLIDEYQQLKDGECWASQSRLAADLDLSVTTVRRSLKALVDAGLITSLRKSRGGRMTVNHYSVVWSEVAESRGQVDTHFNTAEVDGASVTSDQVDHEFYAERNSYGIESASTVHKVTNTRPPRSEHSSKVPPSTVHHERQVEREKKEKTTTTVLVTIVEKLEQLLSSLTERLAKLLSLPSKRTENVRLPKVDGAPSTEWQQVERAISSKGVKYATRAAQACRERGENPADVLALLESANVRATTLANRLIHGAAIPTAKPAKSKAKTATDLWEEFCGFCSAKGLDRFAEIPRFESVIAKHGLEMPDWLNSEVAA